MLMRAVLPICLMTGMAQAAPVDIQLRGPAGQPIADAVVIVKTAHPAGPIRFPGPYVMSQKNISFQPHVLIVPVGTAVSFPNLDTVRHHVYSFSKAKKFELKLYGHDESRSITFDQPGLIAVGCNIHDSMSGYILVVDTPYAAKTDATGHARFDVPAGGATLQIWAPAIHAPDNMMTQPLPIPAGGVTKSLVIGA